TDSGGPQFLIRGDETGFIARSAGEFAFHVRSLMQAPERLHRMRQAARADALAASWDGIFEGMYADYERGLRACPHARQKAKVQQHPFVVASGPARHQPERGLN